MYKITQFEAGAPAINGDLGLTFLEDKTDALAVVEADPLESPSTQPTAAPGLARRIWLGVVRAFVAVRRIAAAALANAPARADVVAYVRRYGRRRRIDWRGRTYRVGRHRAQRRWFGRQRSTAQRCAANAVACRSAAREGDLPQVPYEYVSWAETFIETLRREREALHPPQHLRTEFICS